LQSVAKAGQLADSSGPDHWETASLSALSRHIVEKHHAFCREALEGITALLAKTVQAHGANHPELGRIQSLFSGMSSELNLHMMKEEKTLFPMIAQMEDARSQGRPPAQFPFGRIQNPISMMIFEHNDTGNGLKEIRELSKGYEPPADACNTYRSLYEGLREFEADMHQHIYLENYVLFPRTVALERGGEIQPL
ncbi:MAG: hemerythrin domain-containing protein, partial [Terriglobia bacterium]